MNAKNTMNVDDNGLGQELDHAWLRFVALKALMATTPGTFCVGDEISLADVFLYPQVYNAKRFYVDLTAFPVIERIHHNLRRHEAFTASDPDHIYARC